MTTLSKYGRQQALIATAREMAKEDPSIISKVIMAMTAGVESRVQEEHEARVDMEVLASVAMHMAADKGRVTKKTKEYFESLAASKLEKYYQSGDTTCNWAWADKGLE